METEAHVYALAISASVLLAFFPFLTVMLTLCRKVLQWPAAEQAIYVALNDFFAGKAGEFMAYNLRVRPLERFHLTSMLLLLFTANGIFEPLEVALNRAWGVTTNRSYLKNQIISLGLIFACGGLVLFSILITGMGAQWAAALGITSGFLVWVNSLLFKIAALPVSILSLFLVYWLLPNRKIEPHRVLPVAIWVGLLLESLKYVNLLIWPLLWTKLDREYVIFKYSVTILLWSFVASLIVLGGAHWTARRGEADPLE
jgi:membrane protein